MRKIWIAVSILALAAILAGCEAENQTPNDTSTLGESNNVHYFKGAYTEYGGIFDNPADKIDWWTFDTKNLGHTATYNLQLRLPAGTPAVTVAVPASYDSETGHVVDDLETLDCSASTVLCTKDVPFYMVPGYKYDVSFSVGAHAKALGYGFTIS